MTCNITGIKVRQNIRSFSYIRYPFTKNVLQYISEKSLFSASYFYFPEIIVLFNFLRLYVTPLEFTFTTIEDFDSRKTKNYT